MSIYKLLSIDETCFELRKIAGNVRMDRPLYAIDRNNRVLIDVCFFGIIPDGYIVSNNKNYFKTAISKLGEDNIFCYVCYSGLMKKYNCNMVNK